jgi:assimilatory nitrate reductase catalytic subunit
MLEDASPIEAESMPTASQKLTTRTTCPYCGVGCGVLAITDNAGGAEIAGDSTHPANFGRLCSKGSALGETLGLDGRLLYPMRRAAEGNLIRIGWEEALDRAARKFQEIIERHGPDAVALYLSGQLLSEDYYVANKLMKGFIGSSNIDTNSRLCMASTVAGHRRAFGADVVPGCYEDLDEADLVILVGSNAAWCHPILFQRILRRKEEQGARLVVIDTRRTATAEAADLFLQIAPGSDQALFCGLLTYLVRAGSLDERYITHYTSGFESALERARQIAPSIAATAASTGLRESDIAVFFENFAKTERIVTAFSQGVNQSAQGTDKVNAIINCHLATGRIGKPGASPFSLTGQPNAMGGREVGGFVNQLAAHIGFEPENVDRVSRFWNAARMAKREGRKAVQMFEAIDRGEIKALWVVGTNPAVSLPDADKARAALRKLQLLIVSDNVLSNDTINSGAHLLLPAQAWGEKNGTVTNSERRISRQRSFLSTPGEARADWAIFRDFAKRLGFSGFDFRSAADVFREHAALSAFENDGARAFDIGGLAGLSDAAYEALEPVQWPVRAGEAKGRKRMFADGDYFTSTGRANFVAPATPQLATQVSKIYPLRLNTGRIRDQWHTMTRTGVSPRLARHLPEPFVEINPRDADNFGVIDGGFARISAGRGSCVLRAIVTDRQPQGHIFAPIHWSEETSSQGRVGALVAPFVDPFSGQPEAKATPVAISPCDFAKQGFVLARRPLAQPADSWWARASVPGGFGYRLASACPPTKWRVFLREAFSGDDVIEFMDDARGIFRGAAFTMDRIELAVFVGPSAVSWNAVLELFAQERVEAAQRRALLAGRMETVSDDGPLVCACFGVSSNRIVEAIKEGCRTPQEIATKLRAGGNCGSCIPEIKRMMEERRYSVRRASDT